MPPVLELRGISKSFRITGRLARPAALPVLDRIDLTVGRGEVVALVGESGSGKSTIARVISRLLEPDSGQLLLDGRDVLAEERTSASLEYRRRVQMVFQDPYASLNPAHRIGHHLERPLVRLRGVERRRVASAAVELLDKVGLEPAADFVNRFPHELSGGQRQRVAIARALAPEPDLVCADEPTSMLDVSLRVGILNLLDRIRRERGLALLLITHDLASARYLADRIVVLYRGRIVEQGPTDAVINAPAHPYTRALLRALLGARSGPPAQARRGDASGCAPGACPFLARCDHVRPDCREAPPPTVDLGRGHRVVCVQAAQPSVEKLHA